MKLIASILLLTLTLLSHSSFASACSTETAVILENETSLTIEICGANIKGMDDIHDIFVKALKLPPYYGRNFDALYDVLTDPTITTKNLKIVIMNMKELEASIGKQDLDTLLSLFSDI